MKTILKYAGISVLSVLFTAGLVLTIGLETDMPGAPGWVFAASVFLCLFFSGIDAGKRSRKLTLLITVALLSVLLALGMRPITFFKDLVRTANRGDKLLLYRTELFFAVAVSSTVSYYSIKNEKNTILLCLLALLTVAVFWVFGYQIRSEYSVLLILALSAIFACREEIRFAGQKALLSVSLIAAIVACMIVPQNGMTSQPLRNAADDVLKTIISFFNLDKEELEQRHSFTVRSYGWSGTHAYPSQEQVMNVYADETLYLRASIRYKYDLTGWVDETNDEKAGKIKRYMLSGLEGRLYKKEFNSIFDTDKETEPFIKKNAQVEILGDNLFWAVYTPDRILSVKTGDEYNLYYNNIGELFASRRLQEGDSYRFSYLSFENENYDLASSISAAEGKTDRDYSFVLMLNRDIPAGVEPELYELVRNITQYTGTPYEIAQTLCGYLRENGIYSLECSAVPEGRDRVSYFVLNDMKGYCVCYASAMTLMARMAGLPARYVEGYLAKADETGCCTVTGEDAHAWCEIYFKGFGWVTFDATPPESDFEGNDDDLSDNTGNTDHQDSGSEPENDTNDDTEDETEDDSVNSTDNEPQPTPTPEPETDPKDDDPDNPDWPDDPEEPDDDEEDTQDDQYPPEDDESGQPQTNGKQTDSQRKDLLLWILLGIMAVSFLITFTWRRINHAAPDRAEKKYANGKDKMLIWYKACIVALSAAQIRYGNGETPIEFARRAVSNGKAGESFVRFSAMIAESVYSGKKAEAYKKLAELSYREICERLTPKEKLIWRVKRVKNSLGTIERLP